MAKVKISCEVEPAAAKEISRRAKAQYLTVAAWLRKVIDGEIDRTRSADAPEAMRGRKGRRY